MKHKHFNDGNCKKCRDIVYRYPGFHLELANWFFSVQSQVPSIHCSCAGRDEQDQEMVFLRGASKARWGQSAHNYNAALDLFFIVDNEPVWDPEKSEWLFKRLIGPKIPNWVQWGYNFRTFRELAHFEVLQWKYLVEQGKLTLIL